MVHFNLDDRYLDENVVGSAISRREAVLLAIIGHLLFALFLAYAPKLTWFQPSPEELARRQALAEQQQEQQQRMVFVEPLRDIPALRAPETAPPSDADRRAQSPVPPPESANPMPRLEGNSREMNEASPPPEQARGPETPAPPAPPEPEATEARLLPPSDNGFPRPPAERERTRPSGTLGEALRNLQRYVQNQTFDNPQGGQKDPGAAIQFDTKGVEFGPWLRRFVAQVKRNWFVPQAAYSFRGYVVMQFNIWRDGHITDVAIVQPSSIDSFNNAAYNAIISSNPVAPLPPEYPSEKAFFTVTFYYNMRPPD
ncbi:MAG: TonB family protein [Vicinamibacterales bacterium]